MDRARIAWILDGEVDLRLRDGRSVRVRPVGPADAEAIQAFVRGLSDTTRRLRFFASIRELAPGMLKRLTDSHGGRDRVLIALSDDDGEGRVVALAQYAADDDGETCDLALVIADDWQGLGLGGMLMDMLIETARDAGFARAVADVLRGNEGMLGLGRAFEFSVTRSPIDATMVRIGRVLNTHWNTTPAAAQPPLLEEEGRTEESPPFQGGVPAKRAGWFASAPCPV